ncbi:hypothetical protein OQA88_860 [Cercophora sp. LCS_1]
MSRRSTRAAVKAVETAPPAPTAPAAPAKKPAKQSPPAPSASASTAPSALPIHLFEDVNAWEAWLEENHTEEITGLFLKISKKSAAVASVTYDEAVDTALCFGWIDGQRKGLDDTHFLQRFTPRRKASIWSKRNVDKVAVLVSSGRMRAAGQAEVDAAKADGRWEKAYGGSSTMVIPEDFQSAVNRNKKAKTFFESLGKTKQYAFVWRIETAKREETRKKRIAEFVQLLAEGETL